MKKIKIWKDRGPEGSKAPHLRVKVSSHSWVHECSISWCLMRDLLIILSPGGDPRFFLLIFFCPYLQSCRHREMAAKEYSQQFSRLTVKIAHKPTVVIAKIQSILKTSNFPFSSLSLLSIKIFHLYTCVTTMTIYTWIRIAIILYLYIWTMQTSFSLSLSTTIQLNQFKKLINKSSHSIDSGDNFHVVYMDLIAFQLQWRLSTTAVVVYCKW